MDVFWGDDPGLWQAVFGTVVLDLSVRCLGASLSHCAGVLKMDRSWG